jgi:hypothetical protein
VILPRSDLIITMVSLGWLLQDKNRNVLTMANILVTLCSIKFYYDYCRN